MADRQALEALLLGKVIPEKYRASDSELRVNLTYRFIERLARFMKAKRKDRGLNFYLLTFSCESWFGTYEHPEFDLHKAKEVLSDLLRAHCACNAICVFEVQPLHVKGESNN